MSNLRHKFEQIINLMSDVHPTPPHAKELDKALDNYIVSLEKVKEVQEKREKWLNLFTELVTSSDRIAEQKLSSLTDSDFKQFCVANRIEIHKATKPKTVKGKLIQKKQKGGKKKPALPEIREPDTVLPGKSSREVTTEAILSKVRLLRSQTTL